MRTGLVGHSGACAQVHKGLSANQVMALAARKKRIVLVWNMRVSFGWGWSGLDMAHAMCAIPVTL
jgi:hypothetical protein